MIARSGAPFNITTGHDNNADTLFTDRPAFATDLLKPGIVVTRYGALDPSPSPGELILPRNYGQGAGFFTLNLRISDGGGFSGLFHDASTENRYSLTLSVVVRNILNTVNPGCRQAPSHPHGSAKPTRWPPARGPKVSYGATAGCSCSFAPRLPAGRG